MVFQLPYIVIAYIFKVPVQKFHTSIHADPKVHTGNFLLLCIIVVCTHEADKQSIYSEYLLLYPFNEQNKQTNMLLFSKACPVATINKREYTQIMFDHHFLLKSDMSILLLR